MRIVVQSPRPTEAKLTWSKEEGLLIEPRFYAKHGHPAVAYMVVQNDKGEELGRYLIKTDGSGRLKMTYLTEIKAVCDGGESEPAGS